MDAHHVAFLPVAIDDEIAVLQFSVHLLAIDAHFVGAEDIVVIGIEVAGHYLVLYPPRNTDEHVEGLGLVLQHLDGDIAVPGVVGGLLQGHVLAVHLDGGRIGSKEVHVEIVVLDTIDIAWHRGDEATEVRGTTGTAEPRLARHRVVGIETVMAVARQGVGIEELTSVDAHATDDTII